MAITTNKAEDIINTANQSMVGGLRKTFSTARTTDLSQVSSDANNDAGQAQTIIKTLEEVAKGNTAQQVEVENSAPQQKSGGFPGFVGNQLLQAGAMAAMGIPAPLALAVTAGSVVKGFNDLRQDPNTKHKSTEFKSPIEEKDGYSSWRGNESEPEQPQQSTAAPTAQFGAAQDIAAVKSTEQLEMDVESASYGLDCLNIHNLKYNPEYQLACTQEQQIRQQGENMVFAEGNKEKNGNTMRTLGLNNPIEFLKVAGNDEDTFDTGGAPDGLAKGPELDAVTLKAIQTGPSLLSGPA